jgi:hypothetical protein
LDNKKYIAFIGDNFTWGQGLYLPSWVDRKPDVLRNLPNDNIHWLDVYPHMDAEDFKIKDELSFTNRVSTELDRICVKKRYNDGGISHNKSIIVSPYSDQLLVDGKISSFEFTPDTILIFQFPAYTKEDVVPYLTDAEVNALQENADENIRIMIKRRHPEALKKLFYSIDSVIKEQSKLYGFEYWYIDWMGGFWEAEPDMFIDIKLASRKAKYLFTLVDHYPIRFDFEGRKFVDYHMNTQINDMMAESILEWLRDKSRGAGGVTLPFSPMSFENPKIFDSLPLKRLVSFNNYSYIYTN